MGSTIRHLIPAAQHLFDAGHPTESTVEADGNWPLAAQAASHSLFGVQRRRKSWTVGMAAISVILVWRRQD